MNPSYCRIRLQKDAAIRRFAEWNALPKVGPLIRTARMGAVRLAIDDRGQWKGNAVFVSEHAGWTLFEDLSGCLGALPASAWLKFAGNDELVFASYNDAICYGELVVISGGEIQRAFFYDQSDPKASVIIGNLNSKHEPFKSWIDVEGYVDEDELGFCKDDGWLWVY